MENKFLAAAGIILLLTILSGCVSYRKRPARLYNEVLQANKTFDAGIVPGVPFKDGKWDTVMKGRVIWAALLYRQGIVRNLIFSGSAVYSPYYEAKIMGLYAQKLGIPEAHIFYDLKAEHSTENVFYGYQAARKQEFRSIALVTDPFQSSLLKGFTRRRFGTRIVHIPFVIDSLKNIIRSNRILTRRRRGRRILKPYRSGKVFSGVSAAPWALLFPGLIINEKNPLCRKFPFSMQQALPAG